MTRNCTNQYYGALGPCCKVDDAINYLVNDRADLFAKIKFVLHSDDDEYWRADEILRWLSALERSGVNHLPIIGNNEAYRRNDRYTRHGVWSWDNCKEIITAGWYQPMMLNSAALRVLAAPSANYGLKKMCRAFDVTHDVGMGPYAWMLGLNHIVIPGLGRTVNALRSGLQDQWAKAIAVHGLKHYNDEDLCDEESKWPSPERYNQTLVLGCGSTHARGTHSSTSVRVA